MISKPPRTAAGLRLSPLRNQSTRATRNMVRSAATDDKTGEVNEMRTRNEPENVAFASTEIRSIHACSPCGHSNISNPVICSNGRGIQRTKSVKDPISEPNRFAKIIPRSALVPSGGHASFLYSTSYNPYRTLPMPIMTLPRLRLRAASSSGVGGAPPTAPPDFPPCFVSFESP